MAEIVALCSTVLSGKTTKTQGNTQMKKLIASMVLLGLLTGCSSIVSDSEYAVVIASTPSTANFIVTNRAGQEVESGVTPATVTLGSSAGYFKGESYTIRLNKPGYAEKIVTITSSIDGWHYGNILFGGLLGMLIVDPATGAMYNLPDRVDVSLGESVSQVNQAEIVLASIDSLNEEQRARLIKLN